jgi:hypothetical protein
MMMMMMMIYSMAVRNHIGCVFQFVGSFAPGLADFMERHSRCLRSQLPSFAAARSLSCLSSSTHLQQFYQAKQKTMFKTLFFVLAAAAVVPSCSGAFCPDYGKNMYKLETSRSFL